MTSHDVPHGGVRTRRMGWVVFAGTVLVAIGIVQVCYGIAALSRPGASRILDFSNVGWTSLAFGLILAAAGLGAMRGWLWARMVAIVLAALSVLANLAFFPTYPIWSTLIIALDVAVIYALALHGRAAKRIRR
jgi:hypothetical protein